MHSPEDAISNSPLNKLPPEIRGIIYSLLLVQASEILISFKRFRRRIEKHGLFPEICMHCGQSLASCKCSDLTLNHEFYYPHQPLPRLDISTGILATCRLVYNEAASLLYRQNSFHFADPTAIGRFIAATDSTHNHTIENLILTIHSARREVRYRWESALEDPRSLTLAKYFPNLKTVIIKLRGQYELLRADDLTNFCGGIAQKLEPCKELEWVHVNGLVDPEAIMAFAPAVQREKSSDVDGREVRTDATSCWSRSGWSNATIWWGNAEENPPYIPPFQLFDLRVKRVLQSSDSHGAKATVREVKLPYVTGVGGVQGGWAFM